MPSRPLVALTLALALFAAPALAQGAACCSVQPAPLKPLEPIPAAASGASGHLDVDSATRAYLDQLPPDKKARSNAYFEGGYWLVLWDFLWSSAVSLVLLQTGWSARMRDRAARASASPTVQTLLYWPQYLLVAAVLSLPFDWYAGWYREQEYGMSNLTLGAWFGEAGKGFLLSLVFGAIAVTVLYAVVRRMERTWWAWGAIATIAFGAIVAMIGPVLISPIFNHPKPLADQRVVAPILSLARANGIDAQEVYEIDASKQTKRVSANVSGLGATMRITLNDNLLARSSLPEIEAVMGHEMGHYVLNHVYKGLVMFGVLIVIGFALINAFFTRLIARNPAWGISGISDVAGLPLVMLLFGIYFFCITPITNTIIRTQEYEADMFGLNAARQPDGFARAALMLSEYRKMEPGPLEEMFFYDHPSGRTRIHSAMRWKAEHPETWMPLPVTEAPAPAKTPPKP